MSDIPHLRVEPLEVSDAALMLTSILKTVFGLDQYILIAVGRCETHQVEKLELHSKGLTPEAVHAALIDVAASTAPGALGG